MMNPLPLNKTNRLKLARAFRKHTRVDMGIDCAIEGQMGEAYTDDAEEAAVFLIELGGFFAYLAGDAQSAAARKLVAALKGSKLFIGLLTLKTKLDEDRACSRTLTIEQSSRFQGGLGCSCPLTTTFRRGRGGNFIPCALPGE
jgi:hypothetical protein